RVHVVAHDQHRAVALLHGGQCAQRHHLALVAADAQLPQVLDLLAEVGGRLDVDLPGSAEAVEVVDVQGAQVDLQRVEDLAHGHAHGLGLGAVDVQVQPGRVGPEAGEQPLQPGGVPAGGDDVV